MVIETTITDSETPPSSVTKPTEDVMSKIQDLDDQITSLNNEVQKLDIKFNAGAITQEEYLNKKNFLAEKIGRLMGQRDQLKS